MVKLFLLNRLIKFNTLVTKDLIIVIPFKEHIRMKIFDFRFTAQTDEKTYKKNMLMNLHTK